MHKEKKKMPPKPKKGAYKGHSKKYPMLAYRVPTWVQTEGTLERIEANIEALHKEYNKQKAPNEKIVNRNDIVFEALDVGLKTLRKEQK